MFQLRCFDAENNHGLPTRRDLDTRERKTARVLLDHIQALASRIVGPDERVENLELTYPERIVLITDHGMRITIEEQPRQR